jgi:hypothetical protein
VSSQSDKIFDEIQTQYNLANQLLSDAKAAKATWDAWTAHPDGWNQSEWEIPYRANKSAWNELIQAIDQMPKPLFFTGEDGVERTIGTYGGTSADLMMDYSSRVGATTANKGYALDCIKYFGAKN